MSLSKTLYLLLSTDSTHEEPSGHHCKIVDWGIKNQNKKICQPKAIVIRRHRGSYMSAHVLLNLLNELRKRDKMRGLPSILSLFSQRV